MTSRKKLLFLCDYYPPAIGGIEVVNKELSERLAEEYDVTVLTQLLPNTEAETHLKNLRIVRVKSPLRSLFPLFGWWKALLLARRADIIHVSPYSSAYLAGLVMPFAWKPYILHVHGFLGREVTQSLYGRLFAMLVMIYERLFFFLPWRRVVCVSQSLADKLQHEKVTQAPLVIHNGIDEAMFRPSEDRSLRMELGFKNEDIIFVFAARPSPLKGADLIIQAIPELLDKHPELHLAFFVPSQDGKNWAIFQKIMATTKHPERIHMFEARPHADMPRIYAMADLVLIPSRTEGFCFQAAEACAMDVTILCPRKESFPEIASGKVIFLEQLDVSNVQAGMEKYFQKNWEVLPPKHFSWESAIKDWKTLYAGL